MRVEPDGQIPLLERHLNRLSQSAQQFSFRCELEEVRNAVVKRASWMTRPSWLRLTLTRGGECKVEAGPLEVQNPRYVVLAAGRVDSRNPLLYHKTTKREIYDAARRVHCNADTEALLANERGEITEITIANVAVLREGQWITPPLSSGLLHGVMRSELLDQGRIVEGIIHGDNLIPGETIRCFNALRGIFDVKFVQTQR
jgi:para-aminobenzoate synthetase/4-amino-4-deoxychorismate lyase